MAFLRAIPWGLAGAVAGFVVGAAGGSLVAEVLHMPGVGFFAVGAGFIAGVLGFVGTLLLALQ